MMKNFEKIIRKYPADAENIANAFQIVLANPERDLECELSALNVKMDEEDIFKLAEDIIKIRFGEE